ncbi:DUF7266 family protein [Halogranum rubrum]|uniref:Flagellin n=1 Tax=Halogranum salarium B-1 TaxID=1210908 RepID=J3JGP2_9EURY|nr:hypothetical protein [Halogranum salarium]EJN60266.1 hypothetical protein HSB1_08690 [Halogranum salarium B-1]
MRSERASSTTLSYVLSLSITAILISGLLVVGGDVVRDQREQTVQNELQVIGQQLAADLMAADRLAQAASGGTVRIASSLSEGVVGSTYTIDVDGTSGTLELSTTNPDVSVTVGFGTETGVTSTTVAGGNLRIVLVGGSLEVQHV